MSPTLHSIIATPPSALTAPAPADEPQVVELGHLVLHHRRAVPELRTAILIIPGTHCHQRPIAYITECHHFKRHWQSFVRPPMRR